MSEQKNVWFNEVRTRRLVVESGDGRHHLEITGTPDGVGLWLENPYTNGQIAILSHEDRLKIGIFGKDPMKSDRVEMDIAIACENGRPVLQMVKKNGTVLNLTPDDLELLLHGDQTVTPKPRVWISLRGENVPQGLLNDLATDVNAYLEQRLAEELGQAEPGVTADQTFTGTDEADTE